jgi:hypothetical protein
MPRWSRASPTRPTVPAFRSNPPPNAFAGPGRHRRVRGELLVAMPGRVNATCCRRRGRRRGRPGQPGCRPDGSGGPSSQGSLWRCRGGSMPPIAGAEGGGQGGQGGQAVEKAGQAALQLRPPRERIGCTAWAARGRRAIDPSWSASMAGLCRTGQSCPVVLPRRSWCSWSPSSCWPPWPCPWPAGRGSGQDSPAPGWAIFAALGLKVAALELPGLPGAHHLHTSTGRSSS